MANEGGKTSFFGYPVPREAGNIQNDYKANKNPLLRGKLLSISAWLISKFEFIQRIFWLNAGFGRLRGLLDLAEYSRVHYPTVIPLATSDPPPLTSHTKREAFNHQIKEVPNRYWSIADFHDAYLSGKLTPLEVVESMLPLIRRDVTPRSDHSVAFVDINVDLVLRAARASTQRYKDGNSLGILDGVPVGVKDELHIAGYRTYSGRKPDPELFKVQTDTVWPVRKWEESGAIMMGKLNMHQIGSDTTNLNLNWGTPRNPHNSQYYCGGSSGGSAYAVSAGLLPIALGLDGGGSIRLPSSFCGIYGLKPSHQRIDGDIPSTVTVIGPIAANIADLEVAYRVMASPNPLHPVSSLFKAPQLCNNKSRPKVLGICQDWVNRAEPTVRNICHQAVQYLRESLDYEVVVIELPYLPEGQLAHAFTILSEMTTDAKRLAFSQSRHWLTDLEPNNKILMSVGAQTPAADYLLAAQLRHLLMAHLAFLFQKYPGLVIVTPTTPIPGWEIDAESDLVVGKSDANKSLRNMEYAWLANFTGIPAISCPVGYVAPVRGVGDVPIGLMGMGEWGSEDALIEWGRDVERYLHEEYRGGRRSPAGWEDVLGNAGL